MDEPQSQELLKIPVRIEPVNLVVVGVLAGFIFGVLIVALDPWLRFPDVPIRINWREAMFTASMLGAYAASLGWIVTSFWRTPMTWLVALLITPIVTGIIALWNNVNAAFGIESDLLVFLPFILVFHMSAVALVVVYLKFSLRFALRRQLAFTAVPVVMAIVAFAALGRLRWSNQDAKDIIHAVDLYASSTVDEDYSIEYIGMRYRDQIAPTGDVRIIADSATYYCQVRLFPQNIEVNCSPEE